MSRSPQVLKRRSRIRILLRLFPFNDEIELQLSVEKKLARLIEQPVSNPFVGTKQASRYQKFRPLYHDIPFQRLRELLGASAGMVLDVACGTGHSTNSLSKFWDDVVGCDVSEEMLAEARRVSNLTFVHAPAERLPFDDHKFGLVNISMGIHWLKQKQFLGEANRVLAPEGYLSIDNYGFTGKMLSRADFESAYKKFYQDNFPAPPRNKTYPDEELLKVSGFLPEKEIPYEHVVAMNLDPFLEFLQTQSNLLILDDEQRVTILPRLKPLYSSYFESSPRELLFAGLLKLYRKHGAITQPKSIT